MICAACRRGCAGCAPGGGAGGATARKTSQPRELVIHSGPRQPVKPPRLVGLAGAVRAELVLAANEVEDLRRISEPQTNA